MKSLEELRALKEKMKDSMGIRNDGGAAVRIVIGMATCGIAAGARPVMKAFTDEITKRGIRDAAVIQTGCIGICQYEPVVEVYAGGEKVTYVKMTPEKAVRIVNDHIVNGNPVMEYTIGTENI